MDTEIKERFDQVLAEMDQAARSVNRKPGSVQLMVVTKGHPVDVVEAVIEAGAQILGENYVEDAIPKIETIREPDVTWHMIGHIQSRKAPAVCRYFSKVHSLDRMKIARLLDRFAGESGINLPVLLECNTSGEGSKFGFPVWDESSWETFRQEVKQILALPHLLVKGLMTMPPWSEDPEESRPYYQRLVRLQRYLGSEFPDADWRELSMGMSGDYQVAIQEGATIIRVGTAILGPRT